MRWTVIGRRLGITTDGDLTSYGLFYAGICVGTVGGLLIKAFKTVLFLALEFCWGTLPDALAEAGWTKDSYFSLSNYIWLFNAFLGALIGVLSVPLLEGVPAASLGAWVKHLHGSSTGTLPLKFETWRQTLTGDWLGGVVLLVLLTALSGASLGPEPLVILVPSTLAGAFATGVLGQPPHIARAIVLAGGAGGLSAFFGLPVASAFAVLELPNADGMGFALEALPACMVASLAGSFFGDALWRPRGLLGHSSLWFPGGMPPSSEGSVTSPEFGMGALFWAAPVGLLAGGAVRLLVLAIKAAHPVAHRLTDGSRADVGDGPQAAGASMAARCCRRAFLLAVAGALNGLIAMRIPSTLFWGEEQMQFVLTRGCHTWTQDPAGCKPEKLEWMSSELLGSSWISTGPPEGPHRPIAGWGMLAIAAAKLLQIWFCETGGFVGGAIYPVAFATAALGTAIGANGAISSLGGPYVYVSAAASIAVGLAALLNAHVFAMSFVLVLQANVPYGSTSAQMMMLLFAVYTHYLVSQPCVRAFPKFNMISSQVPCMAPSSREGAVPRSRACSRASEADQRLTVKTGSSQRDIEAHLTSLDVERADLEPALPEPPDQAEAAPA